MLFKLFSAMMFSIVLCSLNGFGMDSYEVPSDERGNVAKALKDNALFGKGAHGKELDTMLKNSEQYDYRRLIDGFVKNSRYYFWAIYTIGMTVSTIGLAIKVGLTKEDC